MAIQVAARPAPPGGADDVVARRAARPAPGTGATIVEEVFGQVVRVCGRLDVHSVPDVRAALHAAVDAGSDELVVHVDDIVVADATGLGVFVGAHRRAQRRGRQLVLRGVPLPAMRLLRVTRLHRVLEVEGASTPTTPDTDTEAPTTSQERRERAEALLRAPAGLALRARLGQNSRVETSSMPRKAS